MLCKRLLCCVGVLLIASTAFAVGTDSLRGPANYGTNAPSVSREWPCPAGTTLYGQPSKTSGDPDWAAYTSSITSAFNYKVFDHFTGVSGNIGDIHWFGLSLLCCWSACDVNSLQFEVTFYADGATPGAVVCGPFAVAPTSTIIDNVSGFNLYQFDVLSIPACNLPAGWVSIQSVGSAADCAFLWFDSYTGGFLGLQQTNNVPPGAALNDNLAFCLTGTYEPRYGACCIDTIPDCSDGIEYLDCLAAGGRFAQDTLCVDLQPPCGFLPGACCYDNGLCTSVIPAMCGTLVGDANCDGIVDFADINVFIAVLSTGDNGIPGCPVGNCDMDTNGIVDFADINPFIAILSGSMPSPIGMYLGVGTTCDQCPCIIICPPGASDEFEPCYSDTNGGCNSVPPIFGSITCGETICGTSYFDGATRDTDWFQINGLTGANDFTVTAEAEFDLQLLFIVDTGGCVISIPGVAVVGPCVVASIFQPGMPMGTYYVWVGPQFTTTFACTDGNPQYWVTLSCTPVASGACCLFGVCNDGYTEAACVAQGGTYMGDNTVCPQNCPPPPPGETCNSPIVIGAVPYTDSGDTCPHQLNCPASCGANSAPDVVYSWTPTEAGQATASLCGSSYDTVIHVQTGCNPCGTDIVCNDDYCGLQSQVSWAAQAGVEYFIYVTGYSTSCGAYTLNLTVAPPCIVTCPGGATPENEPCNTDTNGGCNSVPPIFGAISCGETICGTSYFDGATRDTDWYTITGVTESKIYTVTAQAEFDLQLLFVTDTGGCVISIPYVAVVGPCVPATITTSCLAAPVSPAAYYVWVGPQFTTAFTCTEGDPQYVVTLTCATCTVPPGDTCETAFPIGAIPFDVTGNSCGFAGDYQATCPYASFGAPDVVYSYTATADDMWDLNLCNSPTNYDTKLFVFQDTCSGTPICCNDDMCQTPEFPIDYISHIPSCGPILTGHTYYVVVSGYSSVDCGDYHLTINSAGPPPPAPANDLCENAQAIVGPYPVTVNGTCIGATIDCPGVLDWTAVWYTFDLPNATNNVTVTLCGVSEAIGTVGVVYFTMCNDCPNYILYSSYLWNSCSFGGGYGIDITFSGVAGPGLMYFPAYVVNSAGAGIDFSLTVNATAAAPGPQLPPKGTAPAVSHDVKPTAGAQK